MWSSITLVPKSWTTSKYVSGPLSNNPGETALNGYTVLGSQNQQGRFNNDYVVNFPAPGIYPYEFDYMGGFGFNDFLVTVPTNAPGYSRLVLPPFASLALTTRVGKATNTP